MKKELHYGLLVTALLCVVAGTAPGLAQSSFGSSHTGDASNSALASTDWLLVEISGARVLQGVHTTLAFDGRGGISGSGGCNNYRASLHHDGNAISVGTIASTRKMCDGDTMKQESSYFAALQSTQHIGLDGSYLVVSTASSSRPLRFTKIEAPTAAPTVAATPSPSHAPTASPLPTATPYYQFMSPQPMHSLPPR